MTGAQAAFLFSLGLALMLLAYAPSTAVALFGSVERRKAFRERFQQRLRLAGLFDAAPTVIVLALALAIVAVGTVLGVITGSVFGALAAILIVPAAAHFMLMQRERSFMHRAANELGPFLNRIQTAAAAGRPVQVAYVEAVEEAKELRRVLAKSAAEMTAGKPFGKALVETIPLFPFRMWSVFVRQLEAHDEKGGDLSSAIEETVTQMNDILILHAEAAADYATQSRQQKLIVAISVGGVGFFAVAVDPEIMSTLWTTVPGIIGAIVAACIMAFGLWFSRKQMRDIEKSAAL